MKHVTIKLLGVGNFLYQPEVCIYDEYGSLAYSGYAYNGMVQVSLCCNRCYRIIAKCCLAQTTAVIYIGRNDIYGINMNTCCQNEENIITFTLSDANYSNLPIEKGEVILWQR